MIRRPPRSTRTDTLFPYTTLFRSGPGEGLARFIGSHSVSADFVDHFRTTAAEFDYGWEARWIREEGYAKLAGEAVSGLLAAQGLSGLDIAHFAAAIPAKGAAGALAAKAGIAADAVARKSTRLNSSH